PVLPVLQDDLPGLRPGDAAGRAPGRPRARGERSDQADAVVAGRPFARVLRARAVSRARTASLVSSRSASEATQRLPRGCSRMIRSAVEMAAAFSARLRFPIWRRAQLIAL